MRPGEMARLLRTISRCRGKPAHRDERPVTVAAEAFFIIIPSTGMLFIFRKKLKTAINGYSSVFLTEHFKKRCQVFI